MGKKEKAKKEKAAAPPPAAAPKKVEHPLKILDKKSPSPLNGDEWKRTYKNNPPEVWKKKLWEISTRRAGRSGSAASSTTTRTRSSSCAPTRLAGLSKGRMPCASGPSGRCS